MKDLLAGGLVRLSSDDRTIMGAGVLLGTRHVLTCAHIAAAALDDESDASVAPAGTLIAEFPASQTDRRFSAGIVPDAWFGVEPEGGGGDVAVLELDGDAPADCAQPPVLRTAGRIGSQFKPSISPDARRGRRGARIDPWRPRAWLAVETS